MPKKFYDIIPPQPIKKSGLEKEVVPEVREKISEKKESGFNFEDIVKPSAESAEKAEREEKKRGGVFKKLFLLILIVGVFFGLIYGFKYYEKRAFVEIKVLPKAESLLIKEEIIIDDKIKEPNFESKIFPKMSFSEQKTVSQDFPVTTKGMKEEKAKGVIKVYNSFSTSSQTLVAQTRFVSDDGKLFRSLQKVVIPGGKYEKNKLVPGEVDIEVQAVQAGEEYNIEPSVFSIPGFSGTPKYTAFYGKSFAPMKGGFKGQVPQVVVDDLDKARDTLVSKLEKEGLDVLKERALAEYILLEKTNTSEIVDETSSAKVGSFVDSFNFTLSARIEVLAIKKADLDIIVNDLITSNIPKNKKLDEKNIKINFLPKNKENGKLTVALEVFVNVLPEIDIQELKKAIAGKPFKEIKFLLQDNLQLSKIEIQPSAFWLRKIPEDINNIKINLTID